MERNKVLDFVAEFSIYGGDTIYLPQHITCRHLYTSSESNVMIMTTVEASTRDQLPQFFIFSTYFRVSISQLVQRNVNAYAVVDKQSIKCRK